MVLPPALRIGPLPAGDAAAGFGLDRVSGRLVELRARSSGGALTCAFGLVLEAQRRGEPAAYIGGTQEGFFPPDAALAGVDLDALVVIRTASPLARARAADELARSGAFALLIVDLNFIAAIGEQPPVRLPPAMLTRLLGLAQKHATAIAFLTAGDGDTTEPGGSNLGSLISLRAAVGRRALDDARQVVTLEAVKDKRCAPGWTHEEICRAPAGWC